MELTRRSQVCEVLAATGISRRVKNEGRGRRAAPTDAAALHLYQEWTGREAVPLGDGINRGGQDSERNDTASGSSLLFGLAANLKFGSRSIRPPTRFE